MNSGVGGANSSGGSSTTMGGAAGGAGGGAAEPQESLLQFFSYAHLPPHLQLVSIPFYTLAHSIIERLPRNPERTVALRKLLEAKDCAVRALIFKNGF